LLSHGQAINRQPQVGAWCFAAQPAATVPNLSA
jgi:hypothetical protein